MQHSSGTDYGENIYASSGRQVNGRAPVESWYNEVKHYTYGHGFSVQTGIYTDIKAYVIKLGPNKIGLYIGHFTQVVWKGSEKLGVGKVTGSNGWTYVVANYHPPGNYANKFRENVLPPGNDFNEKPNKKEEPVKKEEKSNGASDVDELSETVDGKVDVSDKPEGYIVDSKSCILFSTIIFNCLLNSCGTARQRTGSCPAPNRRRV